MTALLIIAAALVGYGLFVLVSPVTGCRRLPQLRHQGTTAPPLPPVRRDRHSGRPGAPPSHRAVSAVRRPRVTGTATPPPLRPASAAAPTRAAPPP